MINREAAEVHPKFQTLGRSADLFKGVEMAPSRDDFPILPGYRTHSVTSVAPEGGLYRYTLRQTAASCTIKELLAKLL